MSQPGGSMPKVLLFDIECTPNLGYVWGKWEQNVLAYKEQWQILCFAYKWLGEKKIYCITAKDDKGDKKVCEVLYDLFNQADVLVAHNGDSFDIKKVRARFVFHGFKATKHIPSVDTKKVAKSNFNFNSNKLDDLGEYLGVGRKQKHSGFDLWLQCMAGNAKAWKEMIKYNIQDVRLLEKIYRKLKPWCKTHPNIAALQDRVGCPKCGSTNVRREGVRGNATTLSQQMQCRSCWGWYLTRYKRGLP